MLRRIEKLTTFTSGSRIGDIEALGFNATINTEDPLNTGFSTWVCDPTVYRQNIAQCRADENEFRSYIQGLQDKMLAAQEETETE